MSGTWVEDDGVLEGTDRWGLVALAREHGVTPIELGAMLFVAPSAATVAAAILSGVSAAGLATIDWGDGLDLARAAATVEAMTNPRNGIARACPRCDSVVYDSRKPAMSRSTPGRDVEICGECGYDEAQYDANGIRLPLVAEWPVDRRYEVQPAA